MSTDYSKGSVYRDKNILWLGLPLFLLICIVSLKGILTPGFYARETLNWQIQSLAQDYTDLWLIAPVLLLSSLFAWKGNQKALFIWGGTMLYTCYTFVLYCFDVKFNAMFPLYCFCLGLSFYSVLYFLYLQLRKNAVSISVKKGLRKTAAVYFILIASLFYLLWLAEIIPSVLNNSVPRSITETGLFTNGVHVLDLSVILPLIFINGLLLLKNHPWSSMLTPVLLSFFILMDICIGFIVVMMYKHGLESSLTLAYVMGILAVFSALMLLLFLKSEINVKTQF